MLSVSGALWLITAVAATRRGDAVLARLRLDRAAHQAGPGVATGQAPAARS